MNDSHFLNFKFYTMRGLIFLIGVGIAFLGTAPIATAQCNSIKREVDPFSKVLSFTGNTSDFSLSIQKSIHPGGMTGHWLILGVEDVIYVEGGGGQALLSNGHIIKGYGDASDAQLSYGWSKMVSIPLSQKDVEMLERYDITHIRVSTITRRISKGKAKKFRRKVNCVCGLDN